ncbi:MAG: helix-turn-helix domain-containing protein [Candidatus Liptonbacteria bacterium]|nr:helix-turn-helix domain-containing protein [Candidatus Liptonbacteria bacterium]
MDIKTEVKHFLIELGLNGAEMAVYLAALELGSGSASAVAKAAGLNRITAYEALKRLSRKGFVRIRAKKNNRTKYFVPAEYSDIVAKLKLKQGQVAEMIEKAELFKHEFEANFSSAEEKPTILFYEGVDGIKEVLNDTLKTKPDQILSFASIESLESGFDQNFLNNYWKRRTNLGIPTRGIIPKTEKAIKEFSPERNRQELRTVRFLSPGLYHFKNEIDIYADCVGIISLIKSKEHGIIIRSASIAESMRAVYETLWELSAGSI